MCYVKPKILSRDNFGFLLKKIGLNVKKIKVIFTELFPEKRLIGPKKFWPIIIDLKYISRRIINFL
jgi:hypothetical protein